MSLFAAMFIAIGTLINVIRRTVKNLWMRQPQDDLSHELKPFEEVLEVEFGAINVRRRATNKI